MHQQMPLFERPSLNVIKSYKKALHKAAKSSRLSREQILDRMNELATIHGIHLVPNGTLKMDTFEKWLNPNDLRRQMPMNALPVFCFVVEDTTAIDALAGPVGAKVIGPEEHKLLRWARAYFRAQDARKEMRSIESALPPGIRKE